MRMVSTISWYYQPKLDACILSLLTPAYFILRNGMEGEGQWQTPGAGGGVQD